MIKSKTIKKIAVAVSGGVDSAVAALLLKQKGYEVIGVFMKNWDENEENGNCSMTNDRADAEYVCKRLNVPFKEVNFVKHYWTHVFCYMLKDYQLGYTPNPDIMCNRHIKFNNLIQFCINQLKVDAIATGHYARTSNSLFSQDYDDSQPVKLLEAKDKFKDQTFFLAQVSQDSLKNVLFPLGEYLKTEVKSIAKEHNLLKVVNKKESTGMCFIGKRSFKHFISNYLPDNYGSMVDLVSGKEIHSHEGLHKWTIGQCCRIKGYVHRYFVVSKLLEENIIYVAPGTHHPALYSCVMYANQINWISQHVSGAFGLIKCCFRFQHTKPKVTCTVIIIGGGSQLIILLDRPLKAITPGQFAVFYKDDECLGSSRIFLIGPSLYVLNNHVPANFDEYGHFYS